MKKLQMQEVNEKLLTVYRKLGSIDAESCGKLNCFHFSEENIFLLILFSDFSESVDMHVGDYRQRLQSAMQSGD